jgi:hypothetical protein
VGFDRGDIHFSFERFPMFRTTLAVALVVLAALAAGCKSDKHSRADSDNDYRFTQFDRNHFFGVESTSEAPDYRHPYGTQSNRSRGFSQDDYYSDRSSSDVYATPRMRDSATREPGR